MSDRIIPEAGDGVILSPAETTSVSIQGDEDDGTAARVQLSADYILISAYNVNLDLDEHEEQIIVVKRREDPSDRIRLLVADYDPLRNTYRITWEGETYATGIRSFAVYTMDVVGDQRSEIVGVGTDDEGNQTTNIFRRREETEGSFGLTYQQIFGATADGSIEIVEERRSDSYRTLQSSGVSFPVVLYGRDDESDNPLDLVRTEYRWRADHGRYTLVSTDRVSGGEIAEEQLRELYDAEEPEMEQFLHGPWFRSDGDDIGASLEIALFNRTDQEITFFRDDAQERYEWINSYKTLYRDGPGLWINLRNQVLRTVRHQVSVTVLGVDTVRITVEGAEYWNGRYQRMTPGIRESVIRRYQVGRPDFELHGVYRNDSDEEILFESPHFRFRTAAFDWRGGFNLVELDKPILELKVVEADTLGNPERTHPARGSNDTFSARYIVEYSEETSEDRIVRRLILHPAALSVDGIERVDGEQIFLEQVEEFLIGD